MEMPSIRISSGKAGGISLYRPSKALTIGATSKKSERGTCSDRDISPPAATRSSPMSSMQPKSAVQSAASKSMVRRVHVKAALPGEECEAKRLGI